MTTPCGTCYINILQEDSSVVMDVSFGFTLNAQKFPNKK